MRESLELEFLNKLSEAYTNYDASIVEDYLAEDVHYVSFWVLQELTSKAEYLAYLKGKLETMKFSNATFEFKIVSGKQHRNALLVGNDECGFVVDFNDDDKVAMINITVPAFF